MKADTRKAASSQTDRPQGVGGGFSGIRKRSLDVLTRKKRDPAAAHKRLDTLLDVARQQYAEKKFDHALRTCEIIREVDPGNAFALRCEARIRTVRGEIERAEVIWRRLYASSRKKVEPAMHLARFAQTREQWAALAEFADVALREDPERVEALRMAILARVRSERFADLFELLPRLHTKEPDRALGFLRGLGGSEQLPALALAFIQAAEATLRGDALTALREQAHKVWLVGARRAMAAKEDTLTGNYLRTVLAIDPSSQEAIDGLSVLSRDSLINLRRAIKKSDRAVAIYHAEITTEINPALVEAWFCLARLIEQDDPARAAEVFRTCATLYPLEPYYQVRLGRSLRRANKLDEALTAYAQAHAFLAADRDPRSAEITTAIADLRPLVFRRGGELLSEGRGQQAWAHFYVATDRSLLRAAWRLTAALPRAIILIMAALLGLATPASDSGVDGSQT